MLHFEYCMDLYWWNLFYVYSIVACEYTIIIYQLAMSYNAMSYEINAKHVFSSDHEIPKSVNHDESQKQPSQIHPPRQGY